MNEQRGWEESWETRRNWDYHNWHPLCEWLAGVKTIYTRRPGKVRVDFVALVILSIAIMLAAILPGPGPLNALGSDQTLFTITEGDYSSPLVSSDRVIRILNVAAGEVAAFAGYDDFATRIEISNKASVVSITRYSGTLLNVLNLQMLTGSVSKLSSNTIYISEGFWERALSRNEHVLGIQLEIHNSIYTIAGVTRGFRGMLAGTDIWLPIGGSGESNDSGNLEGNAFMKIVGTLKNASSWTRAQDALSHCFSQFVRDQFYSEKEGAKLVPLQQIIGVAEPLPILAEGSTSRVLTVGS